MPEVTVSTPIQQRQDQEDTLDPLTFLTLLGAQHDLSAHPNMVLRQVILSPNYMCVCSLKLLREGKIIALEDNQQIQCKPNICIR